MNSKYIKELEEEIKKTKTENDRHYSLVKKKIDKNIIKENLNKEHSKIKNEKEEILTKSQIGIKDLNSSEEKNKKINKSNTIETENSKDINNSEIKQKEKANYYKVKEIKGFNQIKYPNLNFINSLEICQCCNKKFDIRKKIPFLLKCNHIFCKKCLENYFSDEEGIKCPIDGLMGKSFSDLKKLNISTMNENNNDKKEYKTKHKKNKNYNIQEKKSRSNKELIRNKTKELSTKNNYFISTCDKINNFMSNDNNIKYSNSTIKDKNGFNKKYSIFDNNHKKINKSSSFICNNSINIRNIYNNKNYSRSNLNQKYSLENSQNSENEEYESIQNFCNIHPEQRITHFVEDTKELICIHCAFNKLKNNPNAEIKELSEKCKEYLNDLNIIIENNQKYSQIINNSLNDINENKENEKKKIIEIYDQLLNILASNRNNYLIKIEEIFQENNNNMNKKLESFSEIIEIAEKLKEDFAAIYDNAPYEFNHLTQAFNKFIREINENNNSCLDIIQYNFSHDELNKVIKYINNFADVKTRRKIFKFKIFKNNNNNISVEEINNNYYKNYNNLIKNNINFYKKAITKYFKKNSFDSNNREMINNKINKINFRNSSNDLYIKNNSLIHNSNNNLRIKFKYDDKNDKKYSKIFNNNNLFNNYEENNNNNYNGSSSESINETLNKYIASTNMIRDSLYNNAPILDFRNSNNRQPNSVNINNRKIKENLLSEKLELLNKYKIPKKK